MVAEEGGEEEEEGGDEVVFGRVGVLSGGKGGWKDVEEGEDGLDACERGGG